MIYVVLALVLVLVLAFIVYVTARPIESKSYQILNLINDPQLRC